MAPKTIAIIGGLDYDLIMIANRIPDGGESLLAEQYEEALGGKGANSAIATYRTCHKKPASVRDPAPTDVSDTTAGAADAEEGKATLEELGINVRMIGAVGDDKYGEKFYTELTRNGIDCSGVVTVPHTQSSICFVMVENFTRENRCLFTLGATATWEKHHFERVDQLGHGIKPDLCVAQMEIHVEVVEQMIETAGRAGVPFILNAAPANPVTHNTYKSITHLLVNESEAAIMYGCDLDEVNKDSWDNICQEFLDRGVKNVVITLGSKGAYFANDRDRGHCLAYDVEVIDTTGAGDTFTGTYSSDYLKQIEMTKDWNIRRAVERANKAAALTIMKLGAQAGIPWSDEIDEFKAPFKDMAIQGITETLSQDVVITEREPEPSVDP